MFLGTIEKENCVKYLAKLGFIQSVHFRMRSIHEKLLK